MPETTERWVVLDAAALRAAEIDVRDLDGTEALNELFAYRVAITLRDETAVEERAEQLLEQSVTLRFMNGESEARRVNGIVSELTAKRHLESGLSHLELTVVPRAWQLGQRFGAELFLNKSVPEVLADKLRGIGLAENEDFVFALHGQYPVRELIAQYEETDLAFFQRWCEHEGIVVFYDHRGERDVMVLTDVRNSFSPIAQPVIMHRSRREDASAYDVQTTLRRLPAEALVHDYNYRVPRLPLDRTEAVARPVSRGTWVEFGAHTKTPEETKRIAAVRAELEAAKHRVVTGRTTELSMRAGGTFVLRDDASHDRGLLVTRLHCRAHAAEDQTKNWDNAFEAIDDGVMFRPERVTPRPRVSGLLNATVDGKIKGHYAELDDMGRYHVRLSLDRSNRTDLTASHPVRMMQPHSGSYYGMHFPLRPGAEVLIGFVDGNPDRPVIVGAAPNPETWSPVSRPNQTQNVLRTGSNNEMVIEDEHGTERIRIHTPKHRTTVQLGAIEEPEEGALTTTEASISAASRISNNVATRRRTLMAETSSTLLGDSAFVLAGLRDLVRAAQTGLEQPGALGLDALGADLSRFAMSPRQRREGEHEVSEEERSAAQGGAGGLWSGIGSALHDSARGAALSAVRTLAEATDQVTQASIGRSQGEPVGAPATPAFVAGGEQTAALFSRDSTLVYGDRLAALSSFDTATLSGGEHAAVTSPKSAEIAGGERTFVTSAGELDMQANTIRMTGGYYPNDVSLPLDEGTSFGVMSRRDLRILSVEDCILVCAKKNLVQSAHDGDVRVTAGQLITLEGAEIKGKAQKIQMQSGSHSISSGGVTITASKVTIKAADIKLEGDVHITRSLTVDGEIDQKAKSCMGG